MSQFAERYKTNSNLELFTITQSPDDYQTDAVIAAKAELETRKLSPEELGHLEAEHQFGLEAKSKKEAKRRDSANKAKQFGKSVLEIFQPIKESAPTAEKLILLVSIFMALFSIYKLYQGFPFLLFMLNESEASWDLSMLEVFVPMILLPIATVLFWFRKKWGWILIVTHITYSALSSLSLLIITWGFEPSSYSIGQWFPEFTPPPFVFTTLFNFGFLWVLCRQDIRDVYRVDKKLVGFTLAFSVAILALMIYPFI